MNSTKLIITFVLCSIISVQSNAQSWERVYGGNLNENGRSVQQTKDSGFVMVGSTNSFGTGNNDIYLIKTNANGDTLWTRTFGGVISDNGISVKQTYDDGFIIAGETTSFGPAGENIYVIKTNSNGIEQWSKAFGTGQQETCGEVVQTYDSGYCIIGSTGNIAGGLADVYLVKLNSIGDTVLTKNYGGNSIDLGYSIKQTIDSGFIISGATLNSASGKYEALLIKTDINGDTAWTKEFTGTDHTYGNSVIQSSDSGFIAGGTSAENFFAWKVDGNGIMQWSNEIQKPGNNRCNSITQSSDNGYVMAGYTYSFGDGDAMIVKLDNTGNEMWTKLYGGPLDDKASMIQPILNGGFIIVGSTGNFGAQNSDVYLIKTACENFPNANINIQDTFCAGDTLNATLTTIAQNGATYQWMKNDSIIPGAFSSDFLAFAEGTYRLILTDSTGCSNTSNELFLALPKAYFQAQPHEVCIGDNVRMGNFNWSPDTYPFYDWDFGDGTQDTGKTAIHAYNNLGTFLITRSVRMTNGSCNSYTDSVVVSTTAIPPVDFDILVNSMNMINTVACPGDILEFIPYAYTYLFVQPPPFDATSYLWNFGDGSSDTAKSPVHSYANFGSYIVTLTVTNHCGNSDTVSMPVTIDSTSNPVANFSWMDTQGVPGDTVRTCELITFYSISGTEYRWNFGDATNDSTSIDSIIHSYSSPGNYIIQLITLNGCGNSDTLEKTITVAGTCNSINQPITYEEPYATVYPNPFSNTVTFQLSVSMALSTNDNLKLKLYNIQGQQVKQFMFDKLTLTFGRDKLIDGIYFYSISNDHSVISKGKLIVQ